MKNILAWGAAAIVGLPLWLAVFSPIPFVEAWAALTVWGWHVPAALPSWMNWWTVGWANMALSVIFRLHRYRTEEERKASWEPIKQFLVWGYVNPLFMVILAWVVKEVVG